MAGGHPIEPVRLKNPDAWLVRRAGKGKVQCDGEGCRPIEQTGWYAGVAHFEQGFDGPKRLRIDEWLGKREEIEEDIAFAVSFPPAPKKAGE
jgi:hypothetical protein